METNIENMHSPDEEQEARHIRYGIVFSGGGIKFATHAGIMAQMSDWKEPNGDDWLKRFTVFVGTSAGALYSACYAAGYSPAQVAFFAELFVSPALGQGLFDLNRGGLAAAFLRHDLSYFKGAVRGFQILTLLETLFNQDVKKELGTVTPDATNKLAVTQLITARWKETRRAKRDLAFYEKQITFQDIRAAGKNLFLVGVNAYTGQKTIFCALDDPSKWDAEDEALYNYSKPRYINDEDKIKAEIAVQQANLQAEYERESATKFAPGTNPIKIEFRRFENRVYRSFDPKLYGMQMPIAIAVRASISVPGIFDPVPVKRKGNAPNSSSDETDIFFDGGVDDNFSLGVGADPHLGDCSHLLGVFLGSQGLRLPDPNAVNNVTTILMSTANYFGDAVLDTQRLNRRLSQHYITAISAASELDASLTDTNMVGQLIDEGKGIARDFWETITKQTYPATPNVTIDPNQVFYPHRGEYIYLSPGARRAAPSFMRLKTGTSALPDVKLSDVLTQLLPLTSKSPWEGTLWKILYALVFLSVLGLVVLVIDVIEALTGWVTTVRASTGWLGNDWIWLLVELVLAFVVFLIVRFVAYRTVEDSVRGTD